MINITTIVKTATIALFAAGICANAQPSWADILTQTNFGDMTSGNYWQIGPSTQPSPVWTTDLAGISNTLSFAVSSLSGAGNQGGANSCGTVIAPVTYIESGLHWGIKGVGFLGSFNAPSGGVSLTYYPNENLYESVFFHEDPCYGIASDGVSADESTSREYGFFLAGSNSSIWIYWGTHINQSSVVQANVQLTGLSPNYSYYYEMYPTGTTSSCSFQVTVIDAGTFSTVYNNSFSATSNGATSILTTDPNFCINLLASAGATGYASANIAVGKDVQGTLLSSSQLNLNIQRVIVGR